MKLAIGTFPERLRTARILSGLTQGALAQLMGKPGLAISRWERGKSNPVPASAAKLARALHVNMRWLLMGEGPMNLNSTSKGPVPAEPLVSPTPAR